MSDPGLKAEATEETFSWCAKTANENATLALQAFRLLLADDLVPGGRP